LYIYVVAEWYISEVTLLYGRKSVGHRILNKIALRCVA